MLAVPCRCAPAELRDALSKLMGCLDPQRAVCVTRIVIPPSAGGMELREKKKLKLAEGAEGSRSDEKAELCLRGEFDGLFSAGSRTKGLEAALVADFASPSAGACLWVLWSGVPIDGDHTYKRRATWEKLPSVKRANGGRKVRTASTRPPP